MNHIVSTPTKTRVLLVDDEPKVLRALNAALDADFDVHISESARAAKSLIQKHGPFDAVISDQIMPETKGHELLNWCAKNAPSSKRIMLTGLPITDELRQELIGVEKVDFFSKPWDTDKIRQSLQDISIEKGKRKKLIKAEKTQSSQSIIVVEPASQYSTIYEKLPKTFGKPLFLGSTKNLLRNPEKHENARLIVLNMGEELAKRFDIIETLHRRYHNARFLLTADPRTAREITHFEKNFDRINIFVKPFSLTRLLDYLNKTLVT